MVSDFPSTDLVVVKLDAARLALAEAKTIQDAKKIVDIAHAAKVFARRQALGQEAIDYAHDIKISAMRLLGEILQAEKADGGLVGGRRTDLVPFRHQVDDRPTLADLGLTKKESSLAQKIAALPEEEFAQVKAGAMTVVDAINHRAQGTGENEWYTPAIYIEAARQVLGFIDLDPASSDAANHVVRAARFFSESDNGLAQKWEGKVWMNPPYAQPAIQHFMQKLAHEVDAGHVTEAIALTHNYTDTAWFHIGARSAQAVCFTRGRIAFEAPDGRKASPTQGQAFFYYGASPAHFAAIFERFGFVMRRHDV